MTDLQLSLIAIGAGVVACVAAFNWWQEYRFKKQAAAAFARNHPDVLLETPKNMVRQGKSAPRQEPVLGAPEEHVEVEEPATFSPAKATVERPAEMEDEIAVAAAMLDPSLDFIAEMHAGEGIPADSLPGFTVGKRVQIVGLRDDDQWEVVSPSSTERYAELRIGLQLADRQGAINEAQLNAFCQMVQGFSDQHEAVVTFPQRSLKLKLARELDEFCASVDVLIGLNFRSQQPMNLSQVASLAEGAGLRLDYDGAYHYRSESGNSLFTLVRTDQQPIRHDDIDEGKCEALTLLFDVPRVAGGLEVFDYLTDLAQQFALGLGVDMVDDNGRPLTPAGIASIRNQLSQIYARMDDRGIAAGGMAALRVFA